MEDDVRALVAGGIRGDLAALETLYERHRSMVFAVGLSVTGNGPDADEVLQETFLRAFRSLADWRADCKFGTWLYTIAMRVALNWKTRFNRKAPERPHETEAPAAGDAMERGEALAALSAEIEKLPVQQRLALTLKHLQGLTIAEIAEMQGCAAGTVKSNLHHAMTKLKEGMTGKLERTLI